MRTAVLFCSTVVLALVGCNGCSTKPQVSVSDGSAAAAVATTIPDAAPLNVGPVPTASVAAMVNRDRLPAYAGATGSVEGTISVTGDPAPETPLDFRRCPEAAKMYGHAFREGEAKTPAGPRWLADAVVAVTGYSGFFVPEKDEAEEVTVEGCGYARRTMTMTFGQRLEVKNLTKDFWAPMLNPAGPSVLMMAAPRGDAVKLYPKIPGRYELIDHDRKYAIADLYVFLHPLHTTSAVLGTYRIDGVPVGKVKVSTSHPRVSEADVSAEVEIKQGVIQHVDLTLAHVPKAPPPVTSAADGGAEHPRLR